MKKLLVFVLLSLLLISTVSAGIVFRDGVSGKEGDVVYIGDDTVVNPVGRGVRFNANVRVFNATRRNKISTSGSLSLVVQGEDDEGTRLRLSVSTGSSKRTAEILENTPNRLYVKTSGRIIYWKRGNSPVILRTETIRWDWNKVTGKINVAGGEDTAIKFRVHNIEAV